MDASPQKIEMPAFTVIGFAVRTTNAAEMSGSNGKIGPLWGRFLSGGSDAVSGVVEPGTIYAVYTIYESDETGAYDLILGRSVRPGEPVPAEMSAVHLPAARYLIFPINGQSPEAIKAAWGEVYLYFVQHPEERRAFTCDFEQYSDARARIFIALR